MIPYEEHRVAHIDKQNNAALDIFKENHPFSTYNLINKNQTKQCNWKYALTLGCGWSGPDRKTLCISNHQINFNRKFTATYNLILAYLCPQFPAAFNYQSDFNSLSREMKSEGFMFCSYSFYCLVCHKTFSTQNVFLPLGSQSDFFFFFSKREKTLPP